MTQGCIENEYETAFREEAKRMVGWCTDNNLELNVLKTKQMIIDFRSKKTTMRPPFNKWSDS